MRILLTNDDGIAAPGLWAAAGVLSGMGGLTVVAPSANYSGYGPALPPSRKLYYQPYTHAGNELPTVTAYGLAGTPATCAQVGLSGVLGGGPFDLLVSGVNHGANLGYDVFYSGTVGAALTAHLLGVPAIAVSLAAGPAGVQHWEAAAWALREVVRLWQAQPDAGSFYNVNVPNLPQPELDEVLITSPGRTSFLRNYHFAAHSHEDDTISVTPIQAPRSTPEPWSDEWAVSLGCVSVTPFRPFPDLLAMLPPSRAHEAAGLPLPWTPDLAAV